MLGCSLVRHVGVGTLMVPRGTLGRVIVMSPALVTHLRFVERVAGTVYGSQVTIIIRLC